VQQQFWQLLINNAGVFDGVQYATAIDGKPDPDMHGVAGLAQQHRIALLRLHDWRLNPLPALPLRVVTERAQYGTQVVGVDRNFRQLASEVFALHGEKQAPAVVAIGAACTGNPG